LTCSLNDNDLDESIAEQLAKALESNTALTALQ
jgi:hypothetical protein